MSEPLHETTETNWLLFMKRFETEIYPVLFEPFGYSKAEGLIVWHLSILSSNIEDLQNDIKGNLYE